MQVVVGTVPLKQKPVTNVAPTAALPPSAGFIQPIDQAGADCRDHPFAGRSCFVAQAHQGPAQTAATSPQFVSQFQDSSGPLGVPVRKRQVEEPGGSSCVGLRDVLPAQWGVTNYDELQSPGRIHHVSLMIARHPPLVIRHSSFVNWHSSIGSGGCRRGNR